MIIDTHVHLDHEKFKEDLEDVIKRAKEAGVCAFLIPGADPNDLPRAQEIAHRYDEVFFAAGVHPYDLEHYDEAYLEKFLVDEKCIAVGECGLDYYRLPKNSEEKEEIKRRQKELFRAQIALAKRFCKPLIVHIREASMDAKEILIEEGAEEVGGVLHCYNANPLLLEMADFGFYFGIGGVLTFKNAKKLVQILPSIPKSRLLLETDAPYLTPHPYRGKRNEPALTVYVAKKMAEILEMSYEDVCELTTANAKTLFPSFAKVC